MQNIEIIVFSYVYTSGYAYSELEFIQSCTKSYSTHVLYSRARSSMILSTAIVRSVQYILTHCINDDVIT